jgi:hypothetical protein
LLEGEWGDNVMRKKEEGKQLTISSQREVVNT